MGIEAIKQPDDNRPCMKIYAPSPVSSTQPETHTRVGVGMFLISPTGQILIGLRKAPHGQGTWGLVGGHVEFGEDPSLAAIRETLEEIGVDISEPSLVDVTSDLFQESGRHYLTIFYAARLRTPESIKNLEPDKFVEWRWVYSDELPDNLFLSLENFINKIGGPDGLRRMLATFPR